MSLITLHNGPELRFDPSFIPFSEAESLYEILLREIPWKQEQIRMFGNWLNMPRLTAWMGDPDAVYEYSGLVNTPLAWHPQVLLLKNRLEFALGSAFNSVLLKYYRDGNDSMGWHADNEPALGEAPVIASISLGAARKIRFRPIGGGKSLGLDLPSGSLLVMEGRTQTDWQHALPKTKHALGRINLTFRKIIG